MTSKELRAQFLKFFASRGHTVIPSASLIPENDPTVLFTTAGMHPLVPFLLGEKHPGGKRLTNVQKCIRTGDIDEVGDDTHLTFFEMLGNWSLGDYFKKEAIAWSFEFLTDKKWLGVDPSHLAISVFAGDESAPRDEESVALWLGQGIPKDRIAYLGKEDNWWPAGGKHPGPQGPDTEIFYWTGAIKPPKKFDPTDKSWVEIWNNVFMQFNRLPDGTLAPLKQKNVDTGMGLERTVAVLQGKKSVFETDGFVPIIQAIEKETKKLYRSNERLMRVVADHVRSAVMLVSDGVVPSNKDQGYVLRKLIRRSVRYLKQLEAMEAIGAVAVAAADTLKDAYPVLVERGDNIVKTIKDEEAKFAKGLKEVERLVRIGKIELISEGAEPKIYNRVDSKKAFDIYQTYGFPLELIQEELAKKALVVDEKEFKEEFNKHFKKHQDLSRAGAGQKFAGGLADHAEETVRLHTATHLLHQALRSVLGSHVFQKGSNITRERLRFDFSHPEKMTQDQIKAVEKLVNEQIKKDLPVHYEILNIEEAKRRGAIGLFEDKYAQLGGKIKVYFVGDPSTGSGQAIDGYFSKEVCGGPHVKRSSEIGTLKITKEEAVSSGVRRIKAVVNGQNVP